MANATYKTSRSPAETLHKAKEYYLTKATDSELVSDVVYQDSHGNIETFNDINDEAQVEKLTSLINEESRDNIPELKSKGYESYSRKSQYETDHIVFSLTEAEGAFFQGEENSSLLVQAIHNAISNIAIDKAVLYEKKIKNAEGKVIETKAPKLGEGSTFANLVQIHRDTDNFHIHIQVNRTPINHNTKQVGSAIEWVKEIETLSNEVKSELSKLGIELDIQKAGQANQSDETTSAIAKATEKTGVIHNSSKADYEKMDTTDVSEFNTSMSSLEKRSKELEKEINAVYAEKAQLQKALAVHHQIAEQKQKIELLEGNVSSLTEKVETQTAHIDELTAETHKQAETIEQFTAQNEKLSGELEIAKDNATDLQSQLDDANNEVSELVEELALASETLAVKQNEIIGLKEDNKNAHIDLLAVEQALKEVNKSFETQSKLTDVANEKVHTLQTTNDNLKSELEHSKAEYEKQLSQQRVEFMSEMKQQQADFMAQMLQALQTQQGNTSQKEEATLTAENSFKLGVSGATITKMKIKTFVDELENSKITINQDGTVVSQDGEALFKAGKTGLLVNNQSVNATQTAVAFVNDIGGNVSSAQGTFNKVVDAIKDALEYYKMKISNHLKQDLASQSTDKKKDEQGE